MQEKTGPGWARFFIGVAYPGQATIYSTLSVACSGLHFVHLIRKMECTQLVLCD
jgi:hypothetical protein